jgi:tetratricopeptide (TPR) repeat protein
VRYLRVRPLGMITGCFPHVDEETRNILQSAMEEAEDLIDFGKILCDKVCNESDNPLTIYFAYSSSLGSKVIIDRLQEAGKYSVMAEPMLIYHNMPQGMLPDWHDSQSAIKEALQAAPNDWIACHIYMGWRGHAERKHPESSTDLEIMSVLESKIEDDENFSYFLPQLFRIRGVRLARERSVDEAIEMYDFMIDEAKKHDDPLAHIFALFLKAQLVKRNDVPEALAILEQHRQLSKELGLAKSLANNHHVLGNIALARGELNLALHHQLKRFEIGKRLDWDQRHFMPTIAQIHNMMGDGAEALKTLVIHQPDSFPDTSRSIIQRAWALVNLGNINDAETEISKVREIILKSADEVHLGLVYLVEGLIEKAKLDFDNAKLALEQALDIFERYLSVAFINIALIHLCDIEIESLSSGSKNIEISGPWMARLFYHVEKKELPGIEAQAKLLKAKFLQKQEQFDQSERLVSEVQKISESPNVEYLEDVARVLLPKRK